MKKKQIIVGRKINDDLSYDKYLDDLIENDIVDLEETFFTCFHKQLNDNNNSGNDMVDTIDKNGDDKKRITKNMMNRGTRKLVATSVTTVTPLITTIMICRYTCVTCLHNSMHI